MRRIRERVAHAPELLDEELHDPAMLARSLEHVAQVNRYLGGERAVIAALRSVLRDRGLASDGGDGGTARMLRVLDIGSASADIPRALVRYCRAAGIPVYVTATDLHPQMRAIAQQRCADFPEIEVRAADALGLPFDAQTYDIAILAMTLHHFEGDAPVRALREASRVARHVVVSELERAWASYAGARALALTWWRRNPLTRHDGPLSVLRAFTAGELTHIARAAGLRDVRVERRFFHRLLLTARSASVAT